MQSFGSVVAEISSLWVNSLELSIKKYLGIGKSGIGSSLYSHIALCALFVGSHGAGHPLETCLLLSLGELESSFPKKYQLRNLMTHICKVGMLTFIVFMNVTF